MTKDVTTNEDIDNYFFVGSQKFKAKLLEEYPELSQAELEVCILIKMNLDIKMTSDYLKISNRTVEKHRSNIRKKMDLSIEDNLAKIITEINA